MQIKTMRQHNTPVNENANCRTLTTPSAREDMEQQELQSLLVGMKNAVALWKTARQTVTKLNAV